MNLIIYWGWMASSKDLKVEILKKENKYFGKVIWFEYNPKWAAMDSYFETKNQDPSLRNQKWDGLISVENLEFSGNHWKNGRIFMTSIPAINIQP